MAVRAIFHPVCHRRTAQGLPNWIQTMFGRAVFYSTISIDDINAQSGWSLKTEKIRLKWHVCFDTTHTIRHLFLTWTSLYPSLHFLNLTQSYAALPLAFFNFDLHCLSELYLGTYPPGSNINWNKIKLKYGSHICLHTTYNLIVFTYRHMYANSCQHRSATLHIRRA